MAIDSAIDHVFVQDNPRYEFQTLATVPIQGTIRIGEEAIPLSNHTGYMSTIRVTPR